MSDSLRAAWQQIEQLLDAGVNLIPVHDKDEIYNGKLYEAKTPYGRWEKYQYEIIDRAILFHDMAEKYNTTAVAMVCGAISGNLEVIDFDVKYKPGIDAIIVTVIKDLYPDIFEKLRPHITRSGGLHLVYRISDHEVPASTHLANRPKTQEEIDANPKSKKKYVTFVETRGTGGLATAPPSSGYRVRKDIPIQQITWEERCSIIEICKSFNEYYPEEKPYTPPKSERDYYDENPFEHYNRTVDPVELLTSFGWSYVRRNGDYHWFTRPGGRRGEVHAGFNLQKCTYRVWGTKSDLDSDRSYTPATILAHYSFNNDKSLTYAHLVSLGFGRIKPNVERNIAQRKAMDGKPMPSNASESAVQLYNETIEKLSELHPHGIFWESDQDNPNKINISRLGFRDVATKLGFRLYKTELVQIINQFIYRRNLRFFFDTMREYIKEENPDLYESIYNSLQSFLQKNGEFEQSQLFFIDEDLIVKDTRKECYKFYLNGYVYINAQQYTLLPYDGLNEKLIWYEKIQQREFINKIHNPVGLYIDFLNLACNLQNNYNHVQRIIGWLAHDYKDSSTAYIITLVEQCSDPKDGGGSGKNLFCQLLSYTTTVKTIAAGQKKNMDHTNLFQAWNGERILVFSDPKKDFDFEVLKEPAGGVGLIKKLFKDEKTIGVMDLPKFVIPTNFSFEISDGGLERRIIALEFTNFFTQCGGVKKHFGKNFPDANGVGDWCQEDWICYDNFICESIKQWIACDLELEKIILTSTGWEKQFIQTHGSYVHDLIINHWHEWRGNYISNDEFKKQVNDHFSEMGLAPFDKYRPKMPKINKALEEWCIHAGCTYNKEAMRKIDQFNTERGREFILEDAPF